MKNSKYVLLIALIIMMNQALTAQTVPQGMRYQAIARDIKGNPLSNKDISLQIDFIPGTPNGKSVYTEMHHSTTDGMGLFVLTIGEGETKMGQFSKIPWGMEEMWLQISIDENGGNDYKLLAATRLLSVPYALHAGSAESLYFESHKSESKGCNPTGLPFWTNLGNDNVNDACHFIGTIKDVDFIFKTNDVERMRITKGGTLQVLNDASIADNLLVSSNLVRILNNASIADNLFVSNDSVTVDHQLYINENADIAKNLTVGGTLKVNGGFHINGMLEAKCITILGGCDWYEEANAQETIQPGEVTVIDPNGGMNAVKRSTRAYDPLVAGVVSGAGGINPGIGLTQEGMFKGNTKVAMGGKVMVKAVGSVKPGDLLTSSSVPGCAMAAKNRKKAFGAVIGKALSPADANGFVLMLVMMR